MPPTEDREPIGKTYKVVVCGGLNWNMISIGNRLPRPGETYNATSFKQMPGGKGANAAIAVHRLSHHPPPHHGGRPRCSFDESEQNEVEVHMIGCVGPDDIGRKMRTSLKSHFINVERVREDKTESSAIANIWVESETGENQIFVCPGANHVPRKEDFKSVECFGSRPDLVIAQLELNRGTVYQLLKTATSAGIDTLLNPSPAHYLDCSVYKGLTHLILNETEAAIMAARKIEDVGDNFENWDDITDEFLKDGVKHIVITLGRRGAFCSKELGKGMLVDAEEVDKDKIVDTSGAGDTFVGAYAVRWLRSKQTGHWDFKGTVQYACRAAAQTIQKVGCQEVIPWSNQLNAHDNGRLTPTESLKAEEADEV